VRYPRPRFEAWRVCPEAKKMILLWLGHSKPYKERHMFYCEHCHYEGNGCTPEACLVGKKKRFKIGKPRRELNYKKLPFPIIIKRRDKVGAN